MEAFDEISEKSILISVLCRGAKVKTDWVNLENNWEYCRYI